MKSFFRSKELLHSVWFGGLALLVYCITAKGFTDMHVIRNAFAQLSFIPIAYFVQKVTKQSIFSRRWIPEYIIWLVWTLLLPLAMYMEYNIAQDFIRFKGEVLFGNASLLGLILLRVIAFDWLKSKVAHILYGFFYIAVWLVPLGQFIYHGIYGEFISTGAIIALQQTDPKESLEWLKAYVGLPGLMLLGLFFLLLEVAVPIYECRFCRISRVNTSVSVSKKGIGLLTIVVWSITIFKLFPMVNVVDQWNEQKFLQREEMRFNDNYAERYENIQINSRDNLTKGTFIIVVGESESRDYMDVYNSSCGYPNTPWLSKMKNDKNMVLFNNAYSCYNLTKIALGMGFTEASQYNDTSFTDSMSLVDIAKKAGYKTYWFSNQIGEQFSEVPIQMIADRADVVKISTNKYDDGLLPLLDEVNPEEKNLIIIHMAGSHASYDCRFPAEERVFMDKGVKADYANTVYFTDRFTQKVTDYAKEKLNLQAVLYYSDHGEDYKLGHGTAAKKWSTLHIPMWIYMTDEYKSNFPKEAANLYGHRDAYFTNDMIFNTVCGLMGIPSNHYDYREDLASSQYMFTKDSLFAFNRQLSIADDNGDEDFDYINKDKIIINLVNRRKK